jgi:endonuclease G
MASADGEVYVVTGPIYHGNQVMSLKGRVLIPTHLYKAVLDPSRGYYAAYVTRNAPGGDYEVLTLAQLQQLAGIDAFPALPASYKTAMTPLPPPRGNGFQHVNENTGSLGVELQQMLGQ